MLVSYIDFFIYICIYLFGLLPIWFYIFHFNFGCLSNIFNPLLCVPVGRIMTSMVVLGSIVSIPLAKLIELPTILSNLLSRRNWFMKLTFHKNNSMFKSSNHVVISIKIESTNHNPACGRQAPPESGGAGSVDCPRVTNWYNRQFSQDTLNRNYVQNLNRILVVELVYTSRTNWSQPT